MIPDHTGHRLLRTPWPALAAVVVAAAAAALLPFGASDPVLRDSAIAVLAAGPAAAAAVALAGGRPALCMPGLGAAGGYAAGITAMHGHGWIAGVVLGTLVAAALGATLAAIGGRLDAPAFLALTLLATIGGGALVDALPDQLGGETGLGPLPPPGVTRDDGSVAALAPAGLLHLGLGVTVAVTVIAALLVAGGPGPRWRAAGSDRNRAAAAGLRPFRAQVAAMAAAGGLAGVSGAVAAAVTGSVTPSPFGADQAALPLAAALVAGFAGPALAALIGVAEAVAAGVVLPHLGYTGPPSAAALGTGTLVLAALVLPPLRSRLRRRRDAAATDAPAATGPWPVQPPRGGPCGLVVEALPVNAGGDGPVLIPALSLTVAAGTVHGLVGRNGSGKSSALAGIAAALARHDPRARFTGAGGRAVPLPQAGGGFDRCSVDETLRLSAREAGGGRQEAAAAAGRWERRLGLEAVAARPCAHLAHGERRRVELARVLLLRPAVLLCDEPLAGLGAAERAAAVACLAAAAAAGTAILLVEHDAAAVSGLAAAITELHRPLDAAGAAVPA